MSTTKTIVTTTFAFISLILFIVGLLFTLGNADSATEDGHYRQEVGIGLTIGGSVIIVGIMGYYLCLDNRQSNNDYEVI